MCFEQSGTCLNRSELRAGDSTAIPAASNGGLRPCSIGSHVGTASILGPGSASIELEAHPSDEIGTRAKGRELSRLNPAGASHAGRLGPFEKSTPVGSGVRCKSSDGGRNQNDSFHPITVLAGFGLPPNRLGLDALELGRDIPPISNANIIDKANQEALIIRDGKADRVPFHTLDGPGVAKAIRDLGVRYGDPDRIAEVVFGHPHRWHASTGSWMGTVLEMPKGVGAAQQCGKKLAHWKWVIETIIDAACPGASMVVSQGSIINGTYAIRSSEFRTGIRNGFRTGCWAFDRT